MPNREQSGRFADVNHWAEFVATHPDIYRRDEDAVWQLYKEEHGFDPSDFELSPPWCHAGAENNKWARNVFLRDGARTSAWALAGYLDCPFEFAYLWLDFAGFHGLLHTGDIPYSERMTTAAMKKEARALEADFRALSERYSRWLFRGFTTMDDIVQESDYSGSVRIERKPEIPMSDEELNRAIRFVRRGGIRRKMRLGIAGRGSILERVADRLADWTPPKRLLDRPGRKGAKARYAVRWLNMYIPQLGHGEIPTPAKYRFIMELLSALDEISPLGAEDWSEERVRRCLDAMDAEKAGNSV